MSVCTEYKLFGSIFARLDHRVRTAGRSGHDIALALIDRAAGTRSG